MLFYKFKWKIYLFFEMDQENFEKYISKIWNEGSIYYLWAMTVKFQYTTYQHIIPTDHIYKINTYSFCP